MVVHIVFHIKVKIVDVRICLVCYITTTMITFILLSPLSSSLLSIDAGPTIVLGCSSKPYNPLRQVLDFVGSDEIEWIKYDSWGMVTEEGLGNWDFKLGEGFFENGPLLKFGGIEAVKEFRELREACIPLTEAASSIPTKALRGDKYKLLPLLPHFKALQKVIPYSDVLNGSFEPFMNKYVKNEFLRSWLDALAFSLSGEPAVRTGAAALAYTIFDLHRKGSSLDYPKGGFGKISEALYNVILNSGSRVHIKKTVDKICIDNNKVVGIQLADKKIIKSKRGVICNAPVWQLKSLLADDSHKLNEDQRKLLIEDTANKKYTKSFLHLHLGLDVSGLEKKMIWRPHYTVMDRGLLTDPCMDRNMVAVSNPCVLDNTLITNSKGDYDTTKYMIHAYGAGNEDYDEWKNLSKNEYEMKKQKDSEYLYRSVSRALDISIDEIKERSDISLIGSPLTHESFNNRYKGTYGSSWGNMIATPETPINGLYLCGDSIYPGIGVPAVALSGAIAANTMIKPIKHISKII